jgi:hypothetical protein
LCSAQDDSSDAVENAAQAKTKIALLHATKHLVEEIGEKESSAVSLSVKGRRLVEKKYDLAIAELRKKYGLESWQIGEADELIATRNAAADLLEALVEARDNARNKEQNKKKGAARTNGPAVMIGGFNTYASYDDSLAELNKWRGGCVRQGDIFCQNLQPTGVEKDIRQAWRSIQSAVIEVFDRLHPVVLADRHVSGYSDEGLLQSWTRTGSKEDLTVRVPGFTKFQLVSYDIVDAYGTKRRGSVVVGLQGTTSWELVKENTGRGGFYELVKVEP